MEVGDREVSRSAAPAASSPSPGSRPFGRHIDCHAIDYKNIPVKADVIAGIMKLDVESETCFRELDSYVCSDLGVAALVMRVVNSAFYSHGNHIANIPRAISLLGFNVVRSLAMLAFSRSLFATTRNPLFQCHIWQHSLLTALAGQAICGELGNAVERDEAFIGGLMHDIGKVLLFNHNQHRYLDVLALVLGKGSTSVEAERQLFGCDHVEVGREAVLQWKLPERFAEFMGRDLAVPSPDISRDAVVLSLAAGNCIVSGRGIGARPLVDDEARKTAVMAFGFDEARCVPWLTDDFMTALTDNDTYKLCATL